MVSDAEVGRTAPTCGQQEGERYREVLSVGEHGIDVGQSIQAGARVSYGLPDRSPA
jgi:hypothetical protein